jgi:AraC-like DNA-binding protein
VFNLYEKIKARPDFYRQLRCGDSLVTLFHCPLQNKYENTWSHSNYFVYVVEGRKIWHTAYGSYDLQKGDCAFVRKGACIVEQFFETDPCFIFLFMPDEFICEALSSKLTRSIKADRQFHPIISVSDNVMVQAFFFSIMSYFESNREPGEALLELKFRELVLTLADDVSNSDLRSYFSSLLQQPRIISLQQIMEENFCFNLKLDEFARLSGRSLSAFKRDFENLYQVSPGKWLLEKRLGHALHLLTNASKTVSEAAFESGFESNSHFSRAFRQRYGTRPATIKRQATI